MAFLRLRCVSVEEGGSDCLPCTSCFILCSCLLCSHFHPRTHHWLPGAFVEYPRFPFLSALAVSKRVFCQYGYVDIARCKWQYKNQIGLRMYLPRTNRPRASTQPPSSSSLEHRAPSEHCLEINRNMIPLCFIRPCACFVGRPCGLLAEQLRILSSIRRL